MDQTTADRGEHPEDLGVLLLLAYQGFVRALHEHLAARGFETLRPSDGYVFRALADEPRRIVDLAHGLAVSKQAASQIVADMESRGLVRRRADPQDGRASRVELSPRGRDALEEARRFHAAYEARLETRLGVGPAAALRAGLESVVDAEIPREERAGLIRLP
jgi:DNA-binding MarR family transcriptional regulator